MSGKQGLWGVTDAKANSVAFTAGRGPILDRNREREKESERARETVSVRCICALSQPSHPSMAVAVKQARTGVWRRSSVIKFN